MKFFALFLSIATVYGQTTIFDCNQNQCSGRYLDCRSKSLTAPCVINCYNQQSCQQTSITCPVNNTCTLNCMGQQSCQDIMFRPDNSTTNSTLTYPTVNCVAQQSCSNSFVAQKPTNFKIDCLSPQSCSQMKINCGMAVNCTLNCQAGQQSCQENVFNCGQTSDKCFWLCANGQQTCQQNTMQCSTSPLKPNICESDCVGPNSCQQNVQICTPENSKCYCTQEGQNGCNGMNVIG